MCVTIWCWIDIRNNLFRTSQIMPYNQHKNFSTCSFHIILYATPYKIKSKCPFRIESTEKSIFTYRHYFQRFSSSCTYNSDMLFYTSRKIFITFLFRVLITFSSRGCDSNKYSTGIVCVYLHVVLFLEFFGVYL